MTLVSELRILENVRIRRERRLIFPGVVSAQVGQAVNPDTVLAKTELLPGVPIIVDLAAFFRISPSEVEGTLRKRTGDSIEVGETIAVLDKPLVEGGKKIYKSPHRGLIEHISLARGHLLIREESTEDEPVVVVDVAKALNISPRFLRSFCHVKEGDEVNHGGIIASIDGYGGEAVRSPLRALVSNIDVHAGTVSLMKPYSPSYARAYLAGEVVEVLPKMGAIVEATGSLLEGVFGVGNENYGRLVCLTNRQEELIDAGHITEEHEGVVGFGGAGITEAGLLAAIDMKLAGLIVGGFRSAHLVKLLGKDISIGITGQEDIGTTIIATEGFGDIPMLDRTYQMLKKRAGSIASINGRTQIRAGVQRPEVIISHDIPAGGGEMKEGEPPRLAVGSLVRAIVDPYFGLSGEVTAFLPPQRLSTEAMMPMVRVELTNGETVELLVNNVESLRRWSE